MNDLRPGLLVAGLEIGPVAHGGHFVARHEGRVIFVRHALTGEVVDARITSVNRRFARADAVAATSSTSSRPMPGS